MIGFSRVFTDEFFTQSTCAACGLDVLAGRQCISITFYRQEGGTGGLLLHDHPRCIEIWRRAATPERRPDPAYNPGIVLSEPEATDPTTRVLLDMARQAEVK